MRALVTESDECLLVEAAQRDPACFAELYERNFERVYAFVVHRVSDRDAAQDITAEVFHEALTNIGRFEWRGVPFVRWLYKIAASAISDRWRRIAREGLPLDETPETAVDDGTERRALLFQLVDDLPADQRQVVFRRFVDQRSIRDIALEMGRSEGAIKQLQFRALQTLRERTRG